jgi:hypothetical protein
MKPSMTINKSIPSLLAALALAGLSTAAHADVFTHSIKKFTAATASQTLSFEANSFYNPTMGYNGWLHTSAWGYAKLSKGLPVTITATASVAGIHPAIAVWRNAGTAPIDSKKTPGTSIGVGPYTPWADVVIPKALIPDQNQNLVNQGSLKMYFVTNGVDRDGWDEPVPSKFDHSLINRLLDGTPGKVSVTFTPPADGIYKFVVGGMNPDSSTNAVAGTDGMGTGGTAVQDDNVTVVVTFPNQ